MNSFDRATLLREVASFLANRDPGTLDTIRRLLERELDAAGPAGLATLGRRLLSPVEEWDFYPADPLARRIHDAMAEVLLEPSSRLSGLEHVLTPTGRPTVILANHLSYADANVLEVLLRRAGGDEVSQRLTVIAGPKIYSSLRRLFSSLCFGTIKTPQSSSVSSEDAVMNPRDIARAARRSIDAAHERLRAGDTLLVFAEGTRSRTAEMQPVLTASSRYLELPGTRVVPAGITGSEAMFPVGDDRLHTVRIDIRLGSPIDVDRLRTATNGDRRLLMDAVGCAIADTLPDSYRGYYKPGAATADWRALLQQAQPVARSE